jgi:hypothetical protein
VTVTAELQSLLERYVEEHVLHGRTLDAAALCEGRTALVEPLRALIAEYTALTRDLEWQPALDTPRGAPVEGLPSFEGFHTIERIGGGGMGEVYKLRDLRLDRIVAAKVLRPDAALPAGVGAFLGEARSLALFSDRRIVRLLEFRPDASLPVLIMEHVEGFELGRIAAAFSTRCAWQSRMPTRWGFSTAI